MQRFKKLIIALAAILMILSVPLAAAEMTVRWAWTLDDPDVTAYRYQVGGENPDSWTVLPADTDSLELSGLDAAGEYTLYLQRSYDGVNWSPSAVSTAKADPSEIPDVRIYRYDGYELRAEIRDGNTILSYPPVSEEDAVAFISLENERYGLGDIGVRYSLDEPGTATFTYPSDISRETVVSELDKLVNDLVDYITTPAPAPAPEPEPKPVVAEPAPEPVEEPVPETPIVKEYEYAGYTLTATILTGETTLEYPAFITDDEVNTFFALENEKYGFGDLGVVYAFGDDGEVVLTYPEEYSKETVAAELDMLVEDLIAYLTPAPEPEPVADAPIVKEYEYSGYKLIATIDIGATTLEYPAFITDDEVNTFFALENEKYGLGDLGVVYAFGDDGEVVLTYPEEYSKETVAAELDMLVDDLIAYLTPAPEPVEEPAAEPVLPVAPIAPVAVPEEDDPFAFSLLVRGGVASSFDNSFSFNENIFAEVGLGFDFSRIVAIGDNFGFGLRSDLLVDFVPKATGKWNLENGLDYFTSVPARFQPQDGKWRIAPYYHLFGSDELSQRAPVFQSRMPQPYIKLNPADAAKLGVNAGTRVSFSYDGNTVTLPVEIAEGLTAGQVGLPMGMSGIAPVLAGAHLEDLKEAQQ